MVVDVVAAAIASIVIGMIWYSPMAFGDSWMKELGLRKTKKKKNMGPGYVAMVVSTLILAYVLNMFVGYAGATTAPAGALIGALAWLGFVATTSSAGVLWEGKTAKWYSINNGYSLLSFIVMGIVLVIF